MRRAAFLALLASVAVIGGFDAEPRRAAIAYLAAFVWLASLVAASIVLLAIAHTTGSTWMVVLRRRAEDIAAVTPLLVPLFVPIAIALPLVFPWAAPERTWTSEVRAAVLTKHGYLAPAPFVARGVVYLASWVVIAELLRRASLVQDRSPSRGLVVRQGKVAAGSLPWVAFTVTFAAFDWVMSLDPTWSSNVFGIYLFTGAFGGCLGLVGVLVFGPFASRVSIATGDHGHALGRMLLTFVIFWAYIAFSQYLLIWIADLPREVPWMLRRTSGAWGWFAVGLAIGHFLLPFAALLSRDVKLRPRWITTLGAWLVLAHAADVAWLIFPEATSGPLPSWIDLATFVFVGALATAVSIARARGEAEVPVGDPRLARGAVYAVTP